MAGSQPYRVEYQIFTVAYFEPGSVLPATELAKLWSRTSVFGKESCHGNFWHEDRIPRANKPRSFRLGATSGLAGLLDRDSNRPIYGGAARAQRTGRTTDCDIIFELNSGGRQWGYETPPVFMMGLSGQWFERAGTSVYLENLKDQLDAFDRTLVPCGFVDIAASEDCYSGFVYVSHFCSNARLHRWAEHMKFMFACSRRRDQARGVYWGNYFGRSILKRLGGRDNFVRRYRDQARNGNGVPTGFCWEFANGVFVSLSLDPIDCKPGPPISGNVVNNMLWLILELGSRGVLNPWANDGD
jgi:hypothetical protein